MTDPGHKKNPLEETSSAAQSLGEQLEMVQLHGLVLGDQVVALAQDIPGPGSVIGPEPDRIVYNQHRGDVIGGKLWVEDESRTNPGRYILLVSELEDRMRMVFTPEDGWSEIHRAEGRREGR